MHCAASTPRRLIATSNGLGSGFAAPTAAAVTTASKAPARPDALEHVVQRDVPVCDDGELEARAGEALDRGLRIGEGVEGDRVGQRRQHLGSGEIERERVRQQ